MKLLTIEQTAEMMGVHPNTIRAMLPQLGAVDLNRGMKGKRLIRIPEKNIEAYVRECAILPRAVRQARPTKYVIERRKA